MSIILILYPMENYYLFVYGTLKKGFGNNHLLHDADYICTAISVDKYNISGYGFPCAYPNEDGKLLQGEIYLLSDKDFINTDMLEGNGSFYNREIRTFISDGKKIDAWIYIIMQPNEMTYNSDSSIINWGYKGY